MILGGKLEKPTNTKSVYLYDKYGFDGLGKKYEQNWEERTDNIIHCGCFNKWMDRERIYEYQEDGLTQAGSRLFLDNPRGYGLLLREKAEFLNWSKTEKNKPIISGE